jgi:hypothetical protein
MGESYPCLCCGYLTRDSVEIGSFDICPVCGWEDDNVQSRNPDVVGGANRASLTEAKRNFMTFGASDLKMLAQLRAATQDEWPRTK